jgi:hypothetical protein
MQLDTSILSDRVAITDKLALWCHIVDTHSIDRLGEVFLPDVFWDFGEGRTLNNIAELTSTIQQGIVANENCGPTMHNVTNVVVEVDQDSAHSRANCFAAHAGRGRFAGQNFLVWLTYHDRWTRNALGWRVARRTYRWQFTQGPIEIIRGGPVSGTDG